jgi:hypothetical protein
MWRILLTLDNNRLLKVDVSVRLPFLIEYKIVNEMINRVHSLMPHDYVVRQFATKTFICSRKLKMSQFRKLAITQGEA